MRAVTSYTVLIRGRAWTIDHVYVSGDDQPPLYRCGILPMRRDRAELLRDIERAQGPEWRHKTPSKPTPAQEHP